MQLQSIIKDIKTLQLKHDRPTIVAISGFGGAGKSTLAAELCKQLKGSQVVSIDSFSTHEWQRDAEWSNFDRERFTREVLQPARTRRFPLTYVHEPWPGHPEETITISETGLLIVEGCSIFHPSLLSYFDYKIWVDCSLEEATKRAMWRDRHIHKNEHDDLWLNVWMPNDRDFYEKYRPDVAADVKYRSTHQ